MRIFSKLLIGGIAVIGIFIAGIFVLRKIPAQEIIINPAPPLVVFVPTVQVGNTRVPVGIADDGPEVTKGLSGRLTLPEDEGLFFIFINPDRYRFWMPDMHFPIDIIWIEGGKVVGVHENISNEFDPANPKFYLPPVPVRYVLEVNAGFAKAHGISTGMPVTLHLTP